MIETYTHYSPGLSTLSSMAALVVPAVTPASLGNNGSIAATITAANTSVDFKPIPIYVSKAEPHCHPNSNTIGPNGPQNWLSAPIQQNFPPPNSNSSPTQPRLPPLSSPPPLLPLSPSNSSLVSLPHSTALASSCVEVGPQKQQKARAVGPNELTFIRQT